MKKCTIKKLALLCVSFLTLGSFAQDKVLVYHETLGYKHPSIDAGIKMIEDLGVSNGLWTTDNSDNSNVFTTANLANYKAVIWCNTSGNGLLTTAQKNAFENYINNGGGFVGIHAATDTYRDRSWPFYNDLVGAIVQTSPNHTSSTHNNTMDVVDQHEDHDSVEFLNGQPWNKIEEYYYWKNNGGQLYSGNNNLLIVRETGSNDYDESRPIAWYKEYMGGRSFYTALGHNTDDYTQNENNNYDDSFIRHVEGGIKWAGNFSGDVTSVEQLVENGTYFLSTPYLDQNLYSTAGINHNAKMVDANANATNQQWIFTHLGNNIYTIKNVNTNRFLEVPQALCANGANVATWTLANDNHQRWEISKNGDYFFLKPTHCTSRALDRDSNNPDAEVILYNYSIANNDEEWVISKESGIINTCSSHNAFAVIEAEEFCEQSGIQTTSQNSIVGYINNGDWVKYENVNFGSGANSISASLSSGNVGGSVQVRQGSLSGNLLGTLSINNTGSWTTFQTVEANLSSVIGEQDIYLIFTGGSGFLLDIDWFQFSNKTTQPPTTTFIPDPNKTYYIDSAIHNVRLASTGQSESPYTTSTTTTGANVEWKFVDRGNGYWHIDRAAGGTLPRLRSDATEFADMQQTSSIGTYTYYEVTEGFIADSYFLTLPSGPTNFKRLQVDNSNEIKMKPTVHAGTWESFYITEAQNSTVSFTRLEAEDYDVMSGIQTEASSESSDNVGWINNTDWIKFNDINLTGAQSIDARVACDYQGGDIEIRLGSVSGQLIGTLTVVNTGGNQIYETVSTNLSNVSGVNDVYFVFKGGTGYLYNLNWLQFSSTARSSKEIQGANGVEVSVYPNPVLNNLTIANAAGGEFKAYDITGTEVLSSDIASNNMIVNVSTLVTGIYYFKVNYNNGITVIKVVKK